MTDPTDLSSQPIPADDPARRLVVADPDGAGMRHLAIAGGAYTILLSGADTGGKYCLIEMQVPAGAGPPPHRHDFEELFSILEGEIELTFRGETVRAGAGTSVNVPANAPHFFKNISSGPARLLCMCTPPGQELFFEEVGDPLDSRTSPPPKLSDAERAERGRKAKALAPKYRSEILVP